MRTADDEERIDMAGPRPDLTDGRVVVVTVAGKVQVRDAGTGLVLADAAIPAGSGDTVAAYGGRLFSHDEADDNGGPQHIRATDLTGSGASAIVGTVTGRFRSMAGCGPNRVCVITSTKQDDKSILLSAFDVVKHRRSWQTVTSGTGDQIASARGRTALGSGAGSFELFDENGKSIYTANVVTGWLDAGTLFVSAPDGTNRWSRWSIADHKLTPLGPPPNERLGFCASTSSVLICPGESGLRIWRVR
jgi:hypothetical protein